MPYNDNDTDMDMDIERHRALGASGAAPEDATLRLAAAMSAEVWWRSQCRVAHTQAMRT